MKTSQIFFLPGILCLTVAASAVHWALAGIACGFYMFACSAANHNQQ